MSTYDEEWKRQQLAAIAERRKRPSSPQGLTVNTPPEYSIEQTKDGNYRVTTTVKINGKTVTTTADGSTPAAARAAGLERFQNAVHAEYRDNLTSKSDVMSLGQPKEIPAEQMRSKPEDAGASESSEGDQPGDQSETEGQSNTDSPQQEEQEQPNMQIHIKGLKDKHHRDPYNGADGSADRLEEPVPPLVLRPGEAALSAATFDKKGYDNNATIIYEYINSLFVVFDIN